MVTTLPAIQTTPVSNHEPAPNRMLITPSMAQRWLRDGNTANRPLVPSHAERLARDMKEGRWILTHEGLAFDSHGRLLDGQHRLQAIILADVPVEMFVWFNITSEALLAINNGRKRTLVDALTLSDSVTGLTSRHIATLRALLGSFSGPPALTAAEAYRAYQQHWEAIDFAHEFLPGGSGVAGIAIGPVRAVIARAYYSANPDRLEAFCQILIKGIATNELDSIAVQLFQFLMRTAGLGATHNQERYAKTQRALWVFLHADKPGRLSAATQELFPIPGDASVEVH